MLGTAKQTDFKSSPFRAEYTYKPNLILVHPIHISENQGWIIINQLPLLTVSPGSATHFHGNLTTVKKLMS